MPYTVVSWFYRVICPLDGEEQLEYIVYYHDHQDWGTIKKYTTDNINDAKDKAVDERNYIAEMPDDDRTDYENQGCEITKIDVYYTPTVTVTEKVPYVPPELQEEIAKTQMAVAQTQAQNTLLTILGISLAAIGITALIAYLSTKGE